MSYKKISFHKSEIHQIANIVWIIEKARELQRNIYFCFMDYAKAFDCVDLNKLKISSRDGNTRPPYLPPDKCVLQVKKQQLEPDMEQWTGSKLERRTSRLNIVILLTYMQSTSCKMPDWMKFKLESRLPGEISITWICR